MINIYALLRKLAEQPLLAVFWMLIKEPFDFTYRLSVRRLCQSPF